MKFLCSYTYVLRLKGIACNLVLWILTLRLLINLSVCPPIPRPFQDILPLGAAVGTATTTGVDTDKNRVSGICTSTVTNRNTDKFAQVKITSRISIEIYIIRLMGLWAIFCLVLITGFGVFDFQSCNKNKNQNQYLQVV